MEIYEDINYGVLRHTGRNQNVLDVGCGTGLIGSIVKKDGNKVTGITNSPEEVKIARKRLDRVYNWDLHNVKRIKLPKNHFDLIMFNDVLDHILNPDEVLRHFRQFLKPGGRIIVVLPNIASWNIRLYHLIGKYDYKESGILDLTHFHAYTLRTAKNLIKESGYHVVKVDVTPNLARPFVPLIVPLKKGSHERLVRDRKILSSPMYRLYVKLVMPLETLIARLWKTFFSYQFILVAKPK